jgi:hypothetical protein
MKLSSEVLSKDLSKVIESISDFFDSKVVVTESPDQHIKTSKTLILMVSRYVHLANVEKENRANLDTNLHDVMRGALSTGKSGDLDFVKANAENFAANMSEHVFNPAYTAHPTNPKSLELDDLIINIYDMIMLLRNDMAAKKDLRKFKANLSAICVNAGIAHPVECLNKESLKKFAEDRLGKLMQKSSEIDLQPEVKLTVEEEVGRNLQTFEAVFKEFNKTKKRILEDYYEIHGLTTDEQKAAAREIILPSIEKQFQAIHFWSASDADGNRNITDETMLRAVHQHQKHLEDLYLEEIAGVKGLFEGNKPVESSLDEMSAIIQTLEDSEESGKVEEEKDNQKFVEKIRDIILAVEVGLNTSQKEALEDLSDSFQCFKFIGPKMDVRQSSERNVAAMNQILEFANLPDSGLSQFKIFKGKYEDLSIDEKSSFCEVLKAAEVVKFLSTQVNLEKITSAVGSNIAEQEVSRMIAAKAHPDIFQRCIISDNRGIQSYKELKALEAIGFYANTGGMKDENPLAIYPLCENSEDINNLPKMIDDILKNSEFVESLHGKLDLFIGYSDAEKRGGIFALVLLEEKVVEALGKLDKYNEEHPRSKLKVNIFHGQGNDVIRGGEKFYKSTTDQGQGVVAQRFKQVFKQRLYAVAGSEDDFDRQVKQWEGLSPELRETAAKVTNFSVASFEEFILHKAPGEAKDKGGDRLAKFLQDISVEGALGKTNQSSRAKSKGGVVTSILNLDTVRAIGSATRFSACGVHVNVWKGLSFDLTDEKLGGEERICEDMAKLIEGSTVMQDVVLKALYSLAITNLGLDESRMAKAAKINKTPLDVSMVEELNQVAHKSLENIVKFLPIDAETRANLLSKITEFKQPIGELTKNVMKQLKGQFPSMGELLEDVTFNEIYQKGVNDILDQRVAATPDKQDGLNKQLAVLYRAEMQMPQTILDLNTKTNFVTYAYRYTLKTED